MLLLKKIKENIVIRYDFESLLKNLEPYDDSFLELISYIVNTIYLYYKKDYHQFLSKFYVMINIFESWEVKDKDSALNCKNSILIIFINS